MTVPDLYHDVANLVAEASDGQISAAAALAEPESLGLLGLTSMGYVRLIQAIERRYGVAVEPDDDTFTLDTVPALADYLRERGSGLRSSASAGSEAEPTRRSHSGSMRS